jgi:hypothetical protein
MTFDTSGITLQWWSDGWHASFDVPRRWNRLTVTISADDVEVDGMAYEGDESISLPRQQLHAAFGALAVADDWHEVPAEDPRYKLCSYVSKSRPLGIDFDRRRDMDAIRSEAWFYVVVGFPAGTRSEHYGTILEAMKAAEAFR